MKTRIPKKAKERRLQKCGVKNKTLIEKFRINKGIEINSSGYRENLGTPIRDYDIVKRYKELGFEKVSGSLKNLGFKYIAHFEKRKAKFIKVK